MSASSSRAEFCPHFQKAIEVVGKRWSGTILRALMEGPRRFSQIRAHVTDISDRALSMRLKELEAEGLVMRRVEPTTPVSVSYELTDKGGSLERAIAEVERWAEEWVAPAAPEPKDHDRARAKGA
ncbi:MAG: ArsR family transcriptional regulator [Actinobacteria bacterium]|nr:ArsR family transcriptional regulator [Actinomycetota bacterium]